jgi:hypothetical protein
MSTIKYHTGISSEDQVGVQVKLSGLWGAMMLLYIYADILSLFRPGQLQEMTEGMMGPFPATSGALLAAAVLMIIPAAMVFLSLSLKPAANRWTNIILGVLYTLVNIGNLIGEGWAYYRLFGIVEITCTLLIIGHAWKWPKYEN